jgi:hypothetical protein
MYRVNRSARQIGEGGEFVIRRQKLGLELAHLAGGCAAAFEPVGVILIFISGETTIDRLAQQTDDPVPAVLACPTIGKHRTRERGQAKGIIEFTIGKQNRRRT